MLFRRILWIGWTVFLLIPFLSQPAEATVLFSSQASGTCNTRVSGSVWDPTQSSTYPNNIPWYQCAHPVPGRSTYFEVTTQNNQMDAFLEKRFTAVPLTPGTTYYMCMFTRWERVGGVDVFHDGPGFPNSSDKLFELNGNTRILVDAGFPDWADCGSAGCDHKLGFGIYLSPSSCSGCIYEQLEPNVAPYGRSTFLRGDYQKWYALCAGFTPSTGGSATNGRFRMWVNGILTHDYNNIKTNNSASPYIDVMRWSGTIAQPAYDGPAHKRQMDYALVSDSLTDVQNAGFMRNPEAITDMVAPAAPANLAVH